MHGSLSDNLVALSSAEAELLHVGKPTCPKSLWSTERDDPSQAYLHFTYCDNAALVQLTQQLSASKTRTRHLSTRASWLHHVVIHENVSMQFVPTDHQKVDVLTKDLTAYMHKLARQGLRLQICDGL